MRTSRKGAPRGLSLIEAVISLAVFSIGMVGIIEMQIVSARSSAMARKLAQGSALAHDLAENVSLWSYDDPRLAPLDSITSTTAAPVLARSADTRDATITATTSKPHYAENATTNALNESALYTATLPYDGLKSDLDGDGTPDFERYWNVFALDSNGDGTVDGKLVQVIVRWHEPGLGFRRVVESTFIANPGTFSL